MSATTSPQTPATPQSQTLQATVSTPSPGNWRHPRSDEIARRQKANTFNDSNIRKIVWNAGALVALFCAWWKPERYTTTYARNTVYHTTTIPSLADPTKHISSNSNYEQLQHAHHKQSVIWQGRKRFAYSESRSKSIVAEEFGEVEGYGEEIKLWFTVTSGARICREQ
ncbi:MAG: hypothetical protein Q9175_005503 [Cornicularia normoerica]